MNFELPSKVHLTQLVHMWKESFGEHDGFWELFLETGYLPDHCRCITENGQAIAGLYWFDCSCGNDKIAYIYAVVTDPNHRGRGLCRKLMTDVHDLLKKQGYASVMLVPADEGLWEMYRKMGYEDCTRIRSFSCNPGVIPAQIRNISVEEFSVLRRQLIPEGSVLQEGVQLPFLAAQTQLFAGQDFLLAAWLEGNVLHGMELLGNTNAAPGILRALGCEKGIFQTPGANQPYSMIHKLHSAAVVPKHFGFSFD